MHDLDTSFGYQLRLLHAEADRRARQALAPFDMTPARVTALIVIATRSGCNQTTLGEVLSINRASAMKMVNILEARGLVIREIANDPRAHALKLTAEGHNLLDQMLEALRKADEDILAPLHQEKQQDLMSSIRLLTLNSLNQRA